MTFPEFFPKPTDAAIEQIDTLQGLPTSEAFLALMRDSCSQQIINYVSAATIIARDVMVPEALAPSGPSSDALIEDVHINIIKTPGAYTGFGRLTINGYQCDLSIDKNDIGVTWPEAVGDPPKDFMSTGTFAAFMLGVLGSDEKLSGTDKSLILNQSSSDHDLLRTVLQKLAMFYGSYTQADRAVFDNAPNDAFVVDLVTCETPQNGGFLLNIDLVHSLSDVDVVEELDSSHAESTYGTDDSGILGQHIDIRLPQILPSDFVPHILGKVDVETPSQARRIFPHANYDEWSVLCGALISCIERHMEPYAHLDDQTPEELVDFEDPNIDELLRR